MDKRNESQKVPKWLKRVQDNSWEPEILLSGLVLIGLLQLPEVIRTASDYYRAETLSGNLSGLFTALEQIIYVLIFGLIVHLFLRSVWVGLIGLTYTFPKGIQVENLRFQKKFEDKVRQLPSLDLQIILLEKICSSIFATCFFLMMVIFGAIMGGIIIIGVLYLIGFIFNLFGSSLFYIMDVNLDSMFAVIITIMLIDFIGLGLYRKNKYLAKIYYPIHRFFGWITLSRLYRSIYYIFGSNIKKGYLVLFFILFFVSTFFGQIRLQKRPDENILSFVKLYSKNPDFNFFSPYFADRNSEWQSIRLETPQPIVSGRFLEIRTKSDLRWEKQILSNCDINRENLLKNRTAEEEKKIIACINQEFKVSIDGIIYENPDWMYYFHQNDERKGLISFLDVSHLEPGKHRLEVYTRFNDEVFNFGALYFFKE